MTLYTSDIDRKSGKCAFVYLVISIFVALFGGIYETFSHGVYSYYMLYAFGFPLVGGARPALAFCLAGNRRAPSPAARGLYHCGIATFTVGSIVKGVLEIYGTTNVLTDLYFPVAGILVASGIFIYLLRLVGNK